jgi:ubiquinone biosynthesis protein
MNFTRPRTAIRSIKRYREIVAVLIKYGFGEVVGRLNLYTMYRVGRRIFRRSQPPKVSYAVRIRRALEELGPTFVKLGQVLSMRPFLIPSELVFELSKLQDQVAPLSPEIALAAIESNLGGRKISDVFLQLDPIPIASASLSQVHYATLLSGDRAVVKIQRPGIRRVIDADMAILRDIAVLMERHIPEIRQYDPSGIIEELARTTRREINFRYEGRNIETFARNFKEDDRIYIPKVYWDCTTRHMLTMGRIEGIKITDVAALRAAGIDPAVICRNGGEMVFKMIFEDGFFHADPHPGNLFVTASGRIAPVDYGMIGILSSTQMELTAQLLIAIVSNDPAMVAYAFKKAGVLPDDVNKPILEADITELITRYHRIPLAQIDMATMADEFFEIVHRHGIKVQSEFMVFGKALVTFEEVARVLDPDYDFIKSAAPFVRKMALRRFGSQRLKRDAQIAVTELHDMVTKFPEEIGQFTDKLNKGKIKIGLDLAGLERLILELDRSSNRLSFALIIAAVIVGSSLIMTINVGITIFGLPAVGLFGYLFAGFLGAGLAISILRSGRL